MSEEDGLRDEARALIKHGILLSEHTEEIVSGYSGQEPVDVLKEEAQRAANNADNANRERKVALLLVNIGSQMGSDELANAGKQMLKQWEAKYGSR